MSLVLPRLRHQQQQDAVQRIREGRTPASLARDLPWKIENRTWPATGPARITDTQLAALRTALLDTASAHGYPYGRGGPAFDGPAARVLRARLPLTPHEASHSTAWAYLNCCWLLDISVWRWGNDGEIRHFNGDLNRDTFRRLWWRAELFGDDLDLSLLHEDEQVSLAERPQLPRNLVRALVTEFLRHEAVVQAQTQRTFLMRDVAKRLLRSTPLIEYAALDPHDLQNEAFAALESSVSALTGRTPPAQNPQDRSASRRDRAAVPSASAQVRQLPTVGTPSGERPPSPATRTTESPPAPADTARSVSEKVAMAVVRRNGRLTAADLAQLMHTTSGDAGRTLQRLVSDGLLEQRGRTRGTYYVLSPPPEAGEALPAAAQTAGSDLAALQTVLKTITAPATSVLHRLLAAGLVRPGDVLRARTKGTVRRVTVLADGNVDSSDRIRAVLNLSEATVQLTGLDLDPVDVWAVERDGYLKPLRYLLPETVQQGGPPPLNGSPDLEPSDSLVNIVTDLLVAAARDQRLVTYTELNHDLAAATDGRPFDFGSAADRAAMGDLLGSVSQRTLRTDGVMLSAVVTYLNTNDAGTGFYRLAVKLGLLDSAADSRRREKFWIDQVTKVYATYDATRRR